MTNLQIEGSSLRPARSRPQSAKPLSTRRISQRTGTPYHQHTMRSRPGSARRPGSTRSMASSGRWANVGGKTDHDDFVRQYHPDSRPSTAGSCRAKSRPSTAGSCRPRTGQQIRPASAASNTSVRPEFVFTRPAMKNIAEWMATEADNKERRDFKKVHELLSIETDPSGHQTQPVEYGPPVEQQIGLEEQDNDNVDIALENLNAGLNGITMQCWRDNLRTTYQDTFTHGAETMKPKEDMLRTKEKVWQLIGNIVNDDAIDYVSHRIAGLGSGDADLVWDTLQKLAANEEVLRDTKETTYSSTHHWNPFYKKEPRRTDYPNLSCALPLEHTYYPPGMDPPERDPEEQIRKERLRKEAKANDPKKLSQMTHNTLTASSTVFSRMAKEPERPETPDEPEQYYGEGKNMYGVDGGPHTTYTNQPCNPYWEPGRPSTADQPPPPRYTLNVEDDEEDTCEVQTVVMEPTNAQQLPDWVPGASEKRKGERKVLSGKQALMASSIPLNLGLPMPTSSYQGSYIDPASQGQGFDPNKKGPSGSLNAHAMPTQCITGMAAAGSGKVNPSGHPGLISVAGKAAPIKSSPSHMEFLRRLSKSRRSGSQGSVRSLPRPASAHSALSGRGRNTPLT